jgi:transposase
MSNQRRATRSYPRELRERAVRMVLETIEESGEEKGVITRVSRELGITTESLRTWVRQAQRELGPGRAPADVTRIAELEQEKKALERSNFELQRSNEILKSAAAFFARELDPPQENS